MILIFGGTTEGRVAADVCEQAGKPFFYSTKSALQHIELCNGIRLCGAMNASQIQSFCHEHNVRLIVDAAHPFAATLHSEIAAAGLPVVRLQRDFGKRVAGVVYCKDFADAVCQMERCGVERLAVLSGANTIMPLKPFWEKREAVFRILDRDESRQLAHEAGVDDQHIIYYYNDNHRPTVDEEKTMLASIGCDALITKESGESGGFEAKVEAARQLGVKVFVVEHPQLPPSFIYVNGPHTLRRAIERLLPDFFPLRTGLTTGACATAAATAAATALLVGEAQESVCFELPDGERLEVEVVSTSVGDGCAECVVAKDFSDDPDVTKGCRIHAHVRLNDTGAIRFLHGAGVGTVTLPGLGIAVGEPAVNPTPRQMIAAAISELTDRGVDVTISVEGGEELAKRTFNERVGVVGGISIIGTSGIVRPLSNEAFIESIRRELQVAKAVGCDHVALVAGMKSEKALRSEFFEQPKRSKLLDSVENVETIEVPETAKHTNHLFRCVHYGNFIGEALSIADSLGFSRVTLALMIGKAVKLAEGHLDTHSHKVGMNREFLASLAARCGCSPATVAAIASISMAKDLWRVVPQSDSQLFFPAIVRSCLSQCSPLLTHAALDILLVNENGCFTR